MDTLEHRLLFTTFHVNTALDPAAPTVGILSLREAIIDANAAPNSKIVFDVSGTFTVNSALPTITAPVTIDGTTAPGYSGVPIVDINGKGAANTAYGLEVLSAGSGTAAKPTTIEGLAFTKTTDGVYINGASHVKLEANFYGTADGTTASANTVGVLISGGQDDTVDDVTTGAGNGSSVISGNTKYGVEITGAKSVGETVADSEIGASLTEGLLPNKVDGIYTTGGAQVAILDNNIGGNTSNGIEINAATSATPTTILGNDIGFAFTGSTTKLIGNGNDGILLTKSSGVTIGEESTSASFDESNIIIGNSNDGLEISGSTGTVVEDDVIGIDESVPNILGNGANGVELDNKSTGNVIGGSNDSDFEGNLILGNGNFTKFTGGGISVDGTSLDNAIEGNDIGGGTLGGITLGTAQGNASYGIKIASNGTELYGTTAGTTVGGTSSDVGNDIEDNFGDGIDITGNYNIVQNNQIGDFNPDIDGNTGNGIAISGGGSHNLIGSTTTSIFDGGNTIDANGGNGVLVTGAGSSKNSILNNESIAFNGGLPIALTNGGNDAIPAPVLTQVSNEGAGTLGVTGTFDAPAAGTYVLQFYSAAHVTPSGSGQGEFLIGSASVSFAAAGNQTFTTTVLNKTGVNQFVSATITQGAAAKPGDTSEFSNGITEGSGEGQLSISNGSPTVDVSKGAGTETFTVSLAQPNAGPSDITVDYQTEDGTAKSPKDFDATSGELTFLPGQSTATVTVQVNAASASTLPTATYTVDLDDPSGAVIVNNQGVGTIIDSAVQPQGALTVTGPASPIVPGPGAEAAFTISRPSAGSTGVATVTYTTADGTALAGTNYTAESGTVTFAANQTTATVEVPILTPTVTTPSTTFYLNISAPTGATLANTQASATIAAYTVTPPPPTSSIVFTNSAPSSPVNLTTLGTTDWAHWGNGQSFATTSAGAYGEVHDATGGSQISGLTELAGPSSDYGAFTEGSDAQAASMAWTNGSPVASSAGDLGYVYANNLVGAGYSFTAPESATSHTLYLYLGGYDAVGTLTATLPDGTTQTLTLQPGSAGTSGINGHFNTMVKIVYDSATSGTIKISYDKSANYAGNTAGSVDIASAALV